MFSTNPIVLLHAYEDTTFDHIRFWRYLERLAAYRAAKHASETDLVLIQSIFNKIRNAHEKRSTRDDSQLNKISHVNRGTPPLYFVKTHCMYNCVLTKKDFDPLILLKNQQFIS